MSRTINILSRADVEEICKKIIETRLVVVEKTIDRLRQRVNELDNIVCDFAHKKRKYIK